MLVGPERCGRGLSIPLLCRRDLALPTIPAALRQRWTPTVERAGAFADAIR